MISDHIATVTLNHYGISLFILIKSDGSPQFLGALVINEAACWRLRPWCGTKNAFGSPVYSKEYAFLILFT
jgi:hypothetical protein